MQPELLETLSAELYAARLNASPIGQLTARYPDMTLEDAYQIQTLTGDKRLAAGARIVGYKIGLTSAAVQQQLGVNEPDFGLVFADMEIRKDQSLPLQQLIAPKAEGEIGFVFKQALTNPDITLTELKSAIDYFFPVVEVVDSAIADWKITLRDTVADNASSGLYVPGDTFHDPRGVDFASLAIRITGEGTDLSGQGAACLGNPLYATLWLVRKMISLGRPVQPGQLVLSGALAPMVTLKAGQPVVFDFIGLESVRVIAE
jgi:2-keto-4-pentenoate hydratase